MCEKRARRFAYIEHISLWAITSIKVFGRRQQTALLFIVVEVGVVQLVARVMQ